MTEATKISCRDATINALKEEIAGLNKHREKIQTENKQLKAQVIALSNNCINHGEDTVRLEAQLEKAKCCGSCGWWAWYSLMQCCVCRESRWYNKAVSPDNKCKRWEVRE